MKKVILLALLMPLQASGQIIENFESGNLINWVQSLNDHWKADTTARISGAFSLHHSFDNPVAGTDQAGIPLKNLHPSEGTTKWSFLVRHGYDPSASNNWAIFLMSDSGPVAMFPGAGAKGFVIGVNLTGYDDTLRLWKVNGSSASKIVNSRINWQNDIGFTAAVRIVAERSPVGEWKISVYRLNGQLLDTSFGFDTELFPIGWFGVYYKYTSTLDRLLWIDEINIEGIFYEDRETPAIVRCQVKRNNTLEISFNEEPSAETIVPENFSLNSPENISVSVLKINTFTYVITFRDRFINKSINNLIINQICDKAGNCSGNVQVPFTPVWAEAGDVVISEIMADPLPEVSLPGKEYLEMTNRTDNSFNLKNWKLISTDQSYSVNEFIINPKEIVILCMSADTTLFAKYGREIGLKQFPTLTDGGKIICLTDSSGFLIHGVEYSSGWYGNDLKSGGGWSLEMIDTEFPFFGEGNWTASVSRKGGTPGIVNSVKADSRDNSFFGLQNVFPQDSINIMVRFSEPVLNLSSLIENINISDKSIIDLYPIDPLQRGFIVKTNEPLLSGKLYSIEIMDDITDFAGNRIETSTFIFGLPELSGKGDILFNELLFNPLLGDPDYIELYNNSDKIIDASRLYLLALNDKTSDSSDIIQLSEEKRCILPGTYYTVTTDKERIIKRYFSSDPGNIFEIGSLPSMNDDAGHLILYNRELDIIDEVNYDDKMHYSLLEQKEGVSLEKIKQQSLSTERSNWHSASESSGWGTPGLQNSSFIVENSSDESVILSSSRITPDNDGNNDVLVVDLNLKENGNVVSLTIFDETGNFVRKLTDNLLAGPETSIIWDGNTDDGKLVSNGIYIVFIEIYNSSGKVKRWKKVCTVIRG